MDIIDHMMQLPEFSGTFGDDAVSGFRPPEYFSGAANTNSTGKHSITPLANSIDNPPIMPWSSYTHYLPSTTISFANYNPTPTLQEQEQEASSEARLWNSANESGGAKSKSYGTQPQDDDRSEKRNSMAAMREMIFRIAAMQPVHIDPESVKAPKRRNVKISKDPQSVAARHRRERISERIRILQRLVPGGTKMDTASMLDEAIHYVKFLKNQVQSLERVAAAGTGTGFPVAMSSGSSRTGSAGTPNYLPLPKPFQASQFQNIDRYADT